MRVEISCGMELVRELISFVLSLWGKSGGRLLEGTIVPSTKGVQSGVCGEYEKAIETMDIVMGLLARTWWDGSVGWRKAVCTGERREKLTVRRTLSA